MSESVALGGTQLWSPSWEKKKRKATSPPPKKRAFNFKLTRVWKVMLSSVLGLTQDAKFEFSELVNWSAETSPKLQSFPLGIKTSEVTALLCSCGTMTWQKTPTVRVSLTWLRWRLWHRSRMCREHRRKLTRMLALRWVGLCCMSGSPTGTATVNHMYVSLCVISVVLYIIWPSCRNCWAEWPS